MGKIRHRSMKQRSVIPAHAGIQVIVLWCARTWIPVFTGMTEAMKSISIRDNEIPLENQSPT
jgi:hypothetical protein